jgi:hypothetical protein
MDEETKSPEAGLAGSHEEHAESMRIPEYPASPVPTSPMNEEKPLPPVLVPAQTHDWRSEPPEDDAMLEKYNAKGLCDPLLSFPYLYSNVPHPVACRIRELLSKGPDFNPSASVDHAFAFFLNELAKKSNQQFFSCALELVLGFRDCINNNGVNKFINIFKEDYGAYLSPNVHSFSVAQPQVKLSAKISPEYVFICADCFLRDFKPKFFPINSEFAQEFIVMMNKWMVRRSISTVVLQTT